MYLILSYAMLAQTEAATRGVLWKIVIRNFTKLTEKTCTRIYFLQWPATLLKKIPWHRCFPVSSAIFLKTTFLQNTSGSAQIDQDKIVNYFSLKSCLRTVDQHYTGKFLVQFWLRQIKTTLHMVIFLQKDEYKQKQPFADVCFSN